MRPPLRSSRFGSALLGLASLGAASCGALFWSVAPAAAADPSFDCLKAGTAVERLICADDNLATRDSQLSRLYLGALESVDEARAVQERAAQRAWLSERNSACVLTPAEEAIPSRVDSAARCLRNVYDTRIRALQTAYPEPLEIRNGPYVSHGGDRGEACFRFSGQIMPDPLQPLDGFFKVEPAVNLTARADWREVCLGGFEPGKSYKISVLEGLPGEGPPLRRDAVFDFAMPDTPSALRFATIGRILPRHGSGGLPVEGVNVREVAARLMRVGDQDAAAALRSEWDGGPDVFSWGAPDYFISRVQDVVWSGTLALEGARNETKRVALPIDKMIDGAALKPGVYVAILEGKRKLWPKDAAQEAQEARDHQDEEFFEEEVADSVGPVFYWFTVADIGLTTWQGEDGLTVMTRSVDGQQPLSGLKLALRGPKGALLGEATTDETGLANFPAGLTRGEGDRAPAKLYAYGADGEFTQLDLQRAPIDLADRGVAGRVAPGALDAWLTTERGIYRPGESVQILALLRDAQAKAVDDFPLTLVYSRPDGVEARRETVTLSEAGGATTSLNLPPNAAIGRWSAEAYASAEAKTAIGSVSFMVEDFAPPRIEAKLTSDEKSVAPDGEALLKLQADFLYGAPAGGLTGELVTTIRAPATPFANFSAWRFGLADETRPRPEQGEAEAFALDENGALELMAYVPEPEDGVGGFPLEAEFAASVFDAGGKPVTTRFTLPIRTQESFLGAKPSFDGSVAPLEGEVGFDLVAVSPEGEAVAAEVEWRVVREYVNYIWHQRGDRWRTEIVRTDGPLLAEGTASLGATPVGIAVKTESWGSHRLELRRPGEAKAAMSLRFDSGWAYGDPGSEPAPERVQVSIEPGAYAPGSTVRLRVAPPFDGQAAIALASDRIHSVTNHDVSAEGTFVDVTMPEDATAGVYALVTAFGAPDGVMRQVPTRAVGLVWIPADPAAKTLEAEVSLNEVIRPTEPAAVTLNVDAAEGSGPIYGVVFAVDDGVLQLTGYKAPDPANYYLGQRRLGLWMRDGYGQLIDAAGLEIGEIRTGGDADMAGLDTAQLGALPKKNRPIAVWVSDIRELTPGANEIPFDAPDFDGRLRVMATVWTADRVSSATESTVLVRRPVAADAMIPRFLAPGDEAEATVALHNLDGAPGLYTAVLAAEGPLEILGDMVVEAELAQGQRAERVIRVKAREDMGDGKLTLSVAGPEGFGMSRESELSVRPSTAYESRRIVSSLKAGESLIADPSLLEGYYPATARLSLGVNPLPDLDLPGIIEGLARYPYGCAEQTVSTLAPLLASADLRGYFKLDRPNVVKEVDEGIDKGLSRLAAMQNWRGDFGMWSSAGSTNSWLTAYVMDTMLLARTQSRPVSEKALEQGMARLADIASSTGGAADSEINARAYAFYLLAREGSLDPAQLRRFNAVRFAHLTSPLAKAQVAAALARIGDVEAAKDAFARAKSAIVYPTLKAPNAGYRYTDYGTALRDEAGLLALMAESGLFGWPDLDRQARTLSTRMAESRHLSTQEQGWILRAGREMAKAPFATMTIMIDDKPPETGIIPAGGGAVSLSAGNYDAAVALPKLTNQGPNEIYSAISYGGFPKTTGAAEAEGFALTRSVFTRSGEAADLANLPQNEVVVVVLEGRTLKTTVSRALVVDFLPAGLEPENPAVGGAEAADLAWLKDLTSVETVELRDDRFLASFDLGRGEEKSFRVAYLARAVTPGVYVYGGAQVEDMYSPQDFARTEATQVNVRAARPQ